MKEEFAQTYELQPKKAGSMYGTLFQNEKIGIAPTLYYNFYLPFKEFKFTKFGEAFESFYEDYENDDDFYDLSNYIFSIESVKLPIKSWKELENKSFNFQKGDTDGSIYVLSSHLTVLVWKIKFGRIKENIISSEWEMKILFSDTNNLPDIGVSLKTNLEISYIAINNDILSNENKNEEFIMEYMKKFVNTQDYVLKIKNRFQDKEAFLIPNFKNKTL
jgi:hypothetical protein